MGTHEPRADIGVLEPDPDDKESIQLLAQIGCSTQEALGRSVGQNTRLRTTTATTKEVTVPEIYSPPRITQLLREMRARRTKQVSGLTFLCLRRRARAKKA